MHTVVRLGKPERKKQLGRPRRRWFDDIKFYLRQKVWLDLKWKDVA
jgi:hypothetical protein